MKNQYLALEGVRILDLTRLAPGPLCTMILGDLGAKVLKVEELGGPTGRRSEQARGAVSQLILDRASPYNALNRNKRSIALNLKTEEGRKIFYSLAEKSDVVVEEFRPGVAKRLGIAYETLREINPRLIYCAITGYGQDGPYKDLPGHDINYISVAGALNLIGEKGRPPVFPLNLLGDFAGGGMHAAIGILAALIAREKTGKGQFIDIAMFDGVMLLLAQSLSIYFSSGIVPERGRTLLSGAIPHYNIYETKDGGDISIGALEPWFYANLCSALGREDLIPHAWNEEKREEIFSFFREIFLTKTRDEWFEILSRADTCVAKVYSFDELHSDPQIMHRQMIVELDHPTEGKIHQVGVSIKLSDTPGKIRSFAPKLGQDTEEILKELGYTREEAKSLGEKGIVGEI